MGLCNAKSYQGLPQNSTFKVPALIRVQDLWQSKHRENLDKLCSDSWGGLIWQGNGFCPFHKIILHNQQVLIVCSRQGNFQNVHCNQLPGSTHWHVHQGHLPWKMRLCLLASNAFSSMTIHILSHDYPICFLPQSVQGLCYPLMTCSSCIMGLKQCILT